MSNDIRNWTAHCLTLNVAVMQRPHRELLLARAERVLEFFWRRGRTKWNYTLATDYADTSSYVPVRRTTVNWPTGRSHTRTRYGAGETEAQHRVAHVG